MSAKLNREEVDYGKFRFEFLFSVNGHIICQRLFDITNYNEKVLKSMDLKWLADDCVEIIHRDMKDKSVDQIWKYFNPYAEQTLEDIEKSKYISDKKHVFDFEIRVDKKTVIKKQFDGSVYSPNVKYQVDIKDVIWDLISEIRLVFSQKNFTKNYGEVKI